MLSRSTFISSSGAPQSESTARVSKSRRPFNFARRAGVLCALGAALWAPSILPARAQSSNARSAGYKLGPGDVLRLEVARFPEFNQPSFIVPPDGVATISGLGTVRLTGRTRLQVQNELRDILVRRVGMRNPSVALSLLTPRPAAPTIVGRVILSGDVPRPGSFGVRARQRVSDLLAEAGVVERLEEKSATLVRGNKRFTLDLRRAAQYPASAADVFLRPGDSIAVRELVAGKIIIGGDVARPGIYELHRAPRGDGEISAAPHLSDLLTKAGWSRGGSSAQTPATTDVSTGAPSTDDPIWTGTLQRGGMTLAIHPDAALRQISGPDNIRLRAGDVISVTRVIVQPITVYVDGLVAKPASYNLKPGTGVLELLTQAGGPTRTPGEIIAHVRRGGQMFPLDLNALLMSSDSSANLILQNGDYVQLRAPETLDILVAGQVAKPGPLQVKPGATVFEALNQAGSVTIPVEDVRLSVLRKEPGGAQRIMNASAVDILNASDLSTNYILQKGDVINVARNAAQTVFITGEVVNSGSFTLRQGEGLTQLLTRAGGPKDDALLGRVNVTRRGQVLQVDAYDAVKNGKPLSFALQEGDQVLVQKNPNVVAVIEAVAKPDKYVIPERGRLTLTDVLSQAGPLPGTKEVFVVHANVDGTFDTTNVPPIKLDDLRRSRVPNPVLQPRDVVFVPSPKNKTPFLQRLSQLSVLGLFF